MNLAHGVRSLLAAGSALVVFAASGDDWIHQSSSNTTLETAEIMRGDVTGIVMNHDGSDSVWAFRAIATGRFITITGDASNQPGIVYVLDRDGKPFPVGSGYQDFTLQPFAITVDLGDESIGNTITLVFGNYGAEIRNGSTNLYSLVDSGQISPLFIAVWDNTGGQNQFGAEIRRYGLGGMAGVPFPCPSDVNGDTESDVLDFLDFIDSFGTCENQPAPCVGASGVPADFNADTSVDVLDFLDYLDAFGIGCD